MGSSGVNAGIVNNSGVSPEDSISLVVINCDSLGNPTYADSFFVLTQGPSGDSVFAEAVTTSSAHIDSSLVSGVTFYRFASAVADIDGPGYPGVYTLTVVAQRSEPLLRWMTSTQFQIVSSELDDQLALISRIQDSLNSQAEWVARQIEVEHLDGFDPSTDSVLTRNPELYRSTLTAKEIADTLLGRDSLVFNDAYWHKLAERADSGAAGGSSDSASIARWVWNTPQSNHAVPGTFGGNLDGPVSAIGGGSGAYAQTIVAYDSVTQAPIPGVNVAVRNLSQTALLGVIRTDYEGIALINLDAGEYRVAASAAGYSFTPERLMVGSGLPDTVFGVSFDPGTPPSPELCRVFGYLYALDGSPEKSAVIQAYLPAGVARYGGLIIAPLTVSAVTNEDGYFCLDLVPSDSLTPAGAIYEFTIRLGDGTIFRQRLQVPATSQWQLTW